MIVISLGSNLGHRMDYLRRAVTCLGQRVFSEMRCSIVLETGCLLPDGAPDSWNRAFLNMIVVGESPLSPLQALDELKRIERELGRPDSYPRWSPRVIDLDILLWHGDTIDLERLRVPHAELENRPFFQHLLALMGVNDPHARIALDSFSRAFALAPALVGIVNVTPDSFSDGGQWIDPDKAVQQACRLAAEGASLVEVGAQSTRPGATRLTTEQEWARLAPVLDRLKPFMDDGVLSVSVDSFDPVVIERALQAYPVAWINDVTGALDEGTVRRIAEHGRGLCWMHALDVPPRKDHVLPPDMDPVAYLADWAERQVERLFSYGFTRDTLILDPGIGFGKTPMQSMAILRRIDALRRQGVPIMVGHSRKSFVDLFSKQPAAARDAETIALSLAMADAVDYLRVHAVADHMRCLVARACMNG